MTVPVIEARKVTRILPGTVPVTLVNEIDFKAEGGEVVAITGASGSGKSSLLYLLGLLDQPTAGEILVDGEKVSGLPDAERGAIRLAKLGFVFQFHFLLPEFSVIDNILLPMRKLAKLKPAQQRSRAREILAQLGLEGYDDKTPDQLSGGERQRVAIARALANDSRIILADEPTGNLDSRNARIVFEIFHKLASDDGRTVIAVTHDAPLAALCDRQVHLIDGRVEGA
jgi:lipoprotein-releasing system ATP-binding protein